MPIISAQFALLTLHLEVSWVYYICRSKAIPSREYAQPAKAVLLNRVLVNSQSLVHEINSVNYSMLIDIPSVTSTYDPCCLIGGNI